jgi:hypothetical protein
MGKFQMEQVLSEAEHYCWMARTQNYYQKEEPVVVVHVVVVVENRMEEELQIHYHQIHYLQILTCMYK